MADFYVAGPVLGRPVDRTTPEIGELYDLIQGWLQRYGHSVLLPELDPNLTNADLGQFFEAISGRIESSDFVITVFTGESASTPIEAVIGSFRGKQQGILVRDRDRVPRLLAGLPGVVTLEQFDRADVFLGGIVRGIGFA